MQSKTASVLEMGQVQLPRLQLSSGELNALRGSMKAVVVLSKVVAVVVVVVGIATVVAAVLVMRICSQGY